MNNGEVGSRGRGRGWQQTDNQPRELRRPRQVSEDARAEVPKSNLSAEAKEWYPPNYTPPTQQVNYYANTESAQSARLQRFSVQDRLRQAQDQNPYNFEDMAYNLANSESVDIRESIANLITVMCEITFSPGKFDALCGPLVDTFAPTLHDVTQTRPLVEAIVNQSIAEPNFRYNGARLCSMYDSVNSPEESTFRACLLERCCADENKIVSGMETSDENLRGFAMFLAEIYTQLEDNVGGRIRVLGESLCKILLFMLDTGNDINIKAACQLLKLSGIALDADCPTGMQLAFERLKLFSHLPLVNSVMALRAARWGLAEPPLPTPSVRRHPQNVSNGDVDSNIVGSAEGGYLADGHVLTAEERAFLQTHIPTGKIASIDDDILEELENDSWETGMDSEMQAGFLEFLKMSNQIKR